MKKIYVVVAIAGALISAGGISAFGDTAPSQHALPKFVSPAEISKLPGSKELSNIHARQPTSSAPNALPHPLRAKTSNPVFIGGPPDSKKNAAVSGQPRRNTAAIGGNNISRGKN